MKNVLGLEPPDEGDVGKEGRLLNDFLNGEAPHLVGLFEIFYLKGHFNYLNDCFPTFFYNSTREIPAASIFVPPTLKRREARALHDHPKKAVQKTTLQTDPLRRQIEDNIAQAA